MRERRQFERFAVEPMYAPVRVRLLSDEHFTLEGHAYDVSEGGIQIELDRGIDPGTALAVEITLPAGSAGPGRAVFALGNVVWNMDDELGPARLAIAFTRFARAGDRDRLMRAVSPAYSAAHVRKAA